MKIIIVGPAGSGKTTLLHKIIRMNENNNFDFILDGIELIAPPGGVHNLPNLPNMIITAQTLENVPVHLRESALVLNVQDIRR